MRLSRVHSELPRCVRPSRRSLLCAIAMTFVGCSSAEPLAVEEAESRPIREHEREFDPARYRPVPREEPSDERAPQTTPTETPPVWIERLEKVMGFRVQLHSTTEVDAAQRMLAQLRLRLDSLQIDPGRLDLGFDAPYYKIRAGDFVQKADADALREQLHAAGLVDAWVVRDSIIRIIRERRME